LNFGSKIISNLTGIVLNNHIDDFTTRFTEKNSFGLSPSLSNLILPGKRPMSSIIPTIVLNKDGRLLYSLGGSGGTTIIPALFETLINLIDFKLNLKESIERKRIFARVGLTMYEKGYNENIIQKLEKLGHELKICSRIPDGQYGVGNIQAIENKIDYLIAHSDSRKQGESNGY
jgi:gamma-glutamyltranspeptidase / glutathione hydrolase / leukotriene-C4 hydrolase